MKEISRFLLFAIVVALAFVLLKDLANAQTNYPQCFKCARLNLIEE